MPIFFLLIIIFLLWFTFERKKASRESTKETESFWEKEERAGYVPAGDISDVFFIVFPKELVPNSEGILDEKLRSVISAFSSLTETEIADLSAYSNTDLRLKYGTANFARLSEADENFSKLIPVLGELLALMLEAGLIEEAGALLDFSFTNRIYSRSLFSSYAKFYSIRKETKKLEALIDAAEEIYGPSSALPSELRTILNDTINS